MNFDFFYILFTRNRLFTIALLQCCEGLLAGLKKSQKKKIKNGNKAAAKTHKFWRNVDRISRFSEFRVYSKGERKIQSLSSLLLSSQTIMIWIFLVIAVCCFLKFLRYILIGFMLLMFILLFPLCGICGCSWRDNNNHQVALRCSGKGLFLRCSIYILIGFVVKANLLVEPFIYVLFLPFML